MNAAVLGGIALGLPVGLNDHYAGTEGSAITDRTMNRQGDLGAVFDAHVKHEFVDHDFDATAVLP